MKALPIADCQLPIGALSLTAQQRQYAAIGGER